MMFPVLTRLLNVFSLQQWEQKGVRDTWEFGILKVLDDPKIKTETFLII
jgi:hypothetical protein